MVKALTGGCQCRRIRYAAVVTSTDAYLCHCRMCQRATGGVAAAFVNLLKSDVTWLTEPDWYASSPIARRPFCGACGTPLGFEYPDSDKTDLTIGSFDDPSGFRPTSHFGAEAIHDAWLDTSQLPRERCSTDEKLSSRWKKAGLDVAD